VEPSKTPLFSSKRSGYANLSSYKRPQPQNGSDKPQTEKKELIPKFGSSKIWAVRTYVREIINTKTQLFLYQIFVHVTSFEPQQKNASSFPPPAYFFQKNVQVGRA